MTQARVVLRARRARPFYGRHPWVFAGSIAAVEGTPADGDEVDLYSHAGNFVARGLFNSRSKITVRLYSWTPDVQLDESFFRERLKAAFHLREHILRLSGPGRACRLVFSESDGLCGLCVDRYDRIIVVQFTSLALAQRREMLAKLLVELADPHAIFLRTERGIGKLEGLELHDGLLWGEIPSGPIVIEENGLRFRVDVVTGQKTGFYLDQRDNRQAVARLANGRRVLDAFCFTGGFSLAAVRAGAAAVVGVDVSESALTLARENALLNDLSRVDFISADVFDKMDALVKRSERFGMVILDPPKFARSEKKVEEALRGYRRLQTLALRLLQPNGILVTCCCSGLITMYMLEQLLGHLAAEENQEIQILERRGQAPDHPVSATCPDSLYLKCLICRVSGARN